MKKIYFFFCLLIIVVTACNTEDPIQEPKPDELPPITMTGENTFGFLLDGEVWIPKDDLSNNPFKNIFHEISYDHFSGTLLLSVENIDTTKNINHRINLNPEVENEGMINITPPFNVATLFDFGNLGPCYEYEADYLNSKIDVLKLDLSNRIISATFSLDLFNSCKDTLRITDGRFDYKY